MSSIQTPHTEKQAKRGFFMRNIAWMILIGILIAGMLFIYFSTKMELHTMRSAMMAQQEEMETSANEFLLSNTEDLLLFSTKGIIWALRAELMRGNEEQAHQLINTLVKQKDIELVEFINPKGLIQMSSDMKNENRTFDPKGYEENPLNVNKPVIHYNDNETVNLFAPVMGLETRLGTLNILYTPEQFSFAADSV